MDLQNIITGAVLIAAFLAAVYYAIRKAKSFQPGPDCESDCGCSSKSKPSLK